MLQFAPIKFSPGGGGGKSWSSQICLDLNFPLFFTGGGVPRFLSTYIHTHDRLDKLRSALAEAQLKIDHKILELKATFQSC